MKLQLNNQIIIDEKEGRRYQTSIQVKTQNMLNWAM